MITKNSGSFIQSNYGTKGNFELIVPVGAEILRHWYRDNDNPNLPWVQTSILHLESSHFLNLTLLIPGLSVKSSVYKY
jgi:hypothetical protein